ncbi:hypothetical protein ACHAW5_002378 [Stephanodiscus triporus]|uniref:Uncharacterized protein n=1 Tax=Stephanodiscus triporus TaxID=2934178 RepID=A0ABD3QLP4_9STRA
MLASRTGSALCLSSPDLPSNCVGVDNDEDFLPQATPAPAADDAGSFDQCEDEADVEIWTNGGAANRPANSDYCSREYNGGCYLDSACIETCFQETYGYSAKCSTCFGVIPTCSVSSGCMDECQFDSLGEDCAECNAPCVEKFNECTGLPAVTVGPTVVDSLPAPTASPAPSSRSTSVAGGWWKSLAPTVTMPPSSGSTSVATLPAPTASPSPATNGPSFPGAVTTATLSPTVVCGQNEEGCVDENYRVTYCIPASDGPCPCPDGMTRCPTYDMGTWTAGGYCQPVCCDDGPDGTEVACPDDLFGNFWNVTYCEPIAKGCGGKEDSLPAPTASSAPSSPLTSVTVFWGESLAPTVTMPPSSGSTSVAGGWEKTMSPTVVPTGGPPTEGMLTASPVPTSSSSSQALPEATKSSAPKARLVTASTTVLLFTLLYLS